MQQFEVMPSELDASVNFIARDSSFPGMFEARYVRRCEDYFIVYLSSQSGCRKACRFCHLTQSGQTDGVDATIEQLHEQADRVLAYYDDQLAAGNEPAARVVHFNFMARGEVFANEHVRAEAERLLDGLAARSAERRLLPKFKFSTIMPQEMADADLSWLFGARFQPDVYYSLYSVDPSFRRRWLPKALAPETALAMLADYQQVSRKIPVIHWAFIAGENDSEDDIEAICEMVRASGLRPDVNIVRYNPFSDLQGQEPSFEVIERNALLLEQGLPGSRVKIVGRVGFDVKASCGMFVGGRRLPVASR